MKGDSLPGPQQRTLKEVGWQSEEKRAPVNKIG